MALERALGAADLLALARRVAPAVRDAGALLLDLGRGGHVEVLLGPVERTPSLWIIGVTIALVVLLPLMGRFGRTTAGGAEKAGS